MPDSLEEWSRDLGGPLNAAVIYGRTFTRTAVVEFRSDLCPILDNLAYSSAEDRRYPLTTNYRCRENIVARANRLKDQMRPLLEWGSTGKRQRHVHALAKNLLKLWPALWTFADVPDVEPTTTPPNAACAPPSSTANSHSEAAPKSGERTIERLLTVDQTCRLQRRSLYAYLADALSAKARGDPVRALA